MDDPSFGIEWGQKRLADLDFADDISAISHTLAGIQEIINNIETLGAKIGLRINCEKTKAMKIGANQHPPILIMQQNEDYVEKFPYLGSYMSSDAIQSRIYAPGSVKLHQFSNGFVLYMVINYHQLECRVRSLHTNCDPHYNACV